MKRAWHFRIQNNNQHADIIDTSGYDSLVPQNEKPARLLVQMPFRRNGPRKRISRAISKKSRELTKLKTDYLDLQRKYKTTRRSLQGKLKEDVPNKANTPRSKTKAQLREPGLDGERVNKIRKQLLLRRYVQAVWSYFYGKRAVTLNVFLI